jgi:AAA+ superfamily predicted ATPase
MQHDQENAQNPVGNLIGHGCGNHVPPPIEPVPYVSLNYGICQDNILKNDSALSHELEQLNKSKQDIQRKSDVDLSSISFADQIKIDFIRSIDFRILCRFLGVSSVNDIKNHPYSSQPIITLLVMESINSFMSQKGFKFVGELNFDQEGNSIPPEKNPWNIEKKEILFTVSGYLFFEKTNGIKKDNIVFYLRTDLNRGIAFLSSYSTDTTKAKNIINELQIYTKKNNCLRGTKLKDINMMTASFSEVEIKKEYTWDNFYYPDEIKDLFQLEIFDFVKNIKKYNEYGINKRGLLIHGRPGGGKTSIGYIICNSIPHNTVIWITPEILSENSHGLMNSIKSLYKLADFLSPCVIILEDLDLFSQDRENNNNLVSLGALMNILDGVNTINNSVTIGSTNRLNAIESALRNRPGRFDRLVEIPPLSDSLRKKMIKNRLKGWKIPNTVLDYIIKETKNWTGATLQEFVNGVHLQFIKSNKKNKNLTTGWVKDIIEKMNEFGIIDDNRWGFNQKEK